ncbi:MAG: M20/M25/M40 family metallo-hydrolase [Bacteroidales bacterium]|nr:M20/M25/M40 family metallo-hydrolase [Bacteroidales bacterium]
MKIKKITSMIILFAGITLLLQSQEVYKPDQAVVEKIKDIGFNQSDVEELSFWMTDFAGPRLTASAGGDRGNEIARKKMEEYGFKNIKIESVREFTRGGWDNLKTYVAMTSPYYVSFAANPLAWTGSTNGALKGEVVLVEINTEEDFAKYTGKLKGKIVMLPSPARYQVNYQPLARRYTDEDLQAMANPPAEQARQGERRTPPTGGGPGNVAGQMNLRRQINEFLIKEGVGVILNNSGSFNVPRSSGASYTMGDPEPVCQVNLAVEAFGRMQRLLQHGVSVQMEVDIQNKFNSTNQVFNVMGEIPGTDPKLKDEIVLLGGHYDAWHGSTGAADNASGCIVMMEALRILNEAGIKPKRTIRVALWGGEEQGLHGSRGYVEKYLVAAGTKEQLPGFEKFQVYFNMDNGTGKFRGIYLQGNEGARPFFEEWFKPFADLGCSTITARNTGSTDHVSIDGAGLPGFQFIQDPIEYSRGYHTVMDTYERLLMDDLKHNSVVVATLAYNAAMMGGKFPRKPAAEQPQR